MARKDFIVVGVCKVRMVVVERSAGKGEEELR